MAAHYTDDVERGRMMAIFLSGYGLGIVLGPQIGGLTYQHFGKEMPFLVLSFFALVDAALQVIL